VAGQIVSIFTNKGGVGKTTTTLSLSDRLAMEGVKTLLIDCDAQCNATSTMTGKKPNNNLTDIFSGTKTADECTHAIRENLYCIPNIEQLSEIEPLIISKGHDGLMHMRNNLSDYCRNNFDITIIDCPPNFGIFVINALFCSDLAIIPTEAGSKNSIEGLFAAEKFIKEINEMRNTDLQLFKILTTKLDGRTNIGRDYLEKVNAKFPDHVFKTYIRACVDFQYAENMNKTIFQTAPKSSGAKSYTEAAKEIIELLELRKC